MRDTAALARRWIMEVWNARRLEAAGGLATSDLLGHHEGGDTNGLDQWKQMFGSFMSAFPDLHLAIEDVVADGSRAAVRWRATGTHTGPGLPVGPTGRAIDVRGTTWFRCEGGRIVEAWDCWNLDGLLASLVAPAVA
jgi:steroid delta-isomerase-like uncharacterized protein